MIAARLRRLPLGGPTESSELELIAMSILDFIDASNKGRSQADVVRLFEDTLLEFGIDKFVYSLIRSSFAKQGRPHHGLARSYPEDWMKHYAAHDYIDADPTYRHAIRQRGLFAWDDLADTMPMSRHEKRVMDEADEAGLKNGISLSLHGPHGEIVGFGLASAIRGERYDRNELSELYAIANQFHLIYCAFDEPAVHPTISLSARQRETLQWVAVGKSRGVIAEIMKISESTVDDHLRHIFRKLDCNDRTVAVLKAIQLGLVRI